MKEIFRKLWKMKFKSMENREERNREQKIAEADERETRVRETGIKIYAMFAENDFTIEEAADTLKRLLNQLRVQCGQTVVMPLDSIREVDGRSFPFHIEVG